MSKYRLYPGVKVGHCIKCKKPLDPDTMVVLELDQRTGFYHDFGGIPEEHSQGTFEFGANCAKLMRKEARAALA